MKIDFNFPRNLRVLFNFLRIIILISALLRLVFTVAYPLFHLYEPTFLRDLPLVDVVLDKIPGGTAVKSSAIGAADIQLASFHGSLSVTQYGASDSLDSLMRWRFFLCDALDFAFIILLFDLLWRLCGNVERGEIFSERNIGVIRKIGWGILVFQILGFAAGLWYARMVGDFVQQHVVLEGAKLHTMPWRTDGSSLSPSLIITGILVLLLAEVFRQGLALKRENELTV